MKREVLTDVYGSEKIEEWDMCLIYKLENFSWLSIAEEHAYRWQRFGTIEIDEGVCRAV